MDGPNYPPILRHKNYGHASVFTAENLLREAKRQKSITNHNVPRICLLDPDGDIVQNLRAEKKGPYPLNTFVPWEYWR